MPYLESSAGHMYLEWNVPFSAGTLVAIAKDTNGNEITRDVIKTAANPKAVKLTPDRRIITADGKDLSYFLVEIEDQNGNLVPTASNLVNFQISGEGKIVGVDNGDANSLESYKANRRKAYSGKAMVIVQSTNKADGLAHGS